MSVDRGLVKIVILIPAFGGIHELMGGFFVPRRGEVLRMRPATKASMPNKIEVLESAFLFVFLLLARLAMPRIRIPNHGLKQ